MESFGQIRHDALMAEVARRVSDGSVLKLLRGWLRAGVLEHGSVTATVSGTPQGIPANSPNAIANFEFDVALDYRRGERLFSKPRQRFTTIGDVKGSM